MISSDELEQRLFQEIKKRIEATEDQLIIGISGHGAAGKSTFAKKVLRLLGHDKVNYIEADAYLVNSFIRQNSTIEYSYQGKNYREKMTASHPAAHHVLSLERDIKMIKNHMDILTIDTHWQQSELISSKKKITIIEGMTTAFINPDLFDIKIYFYTDEDTELKRRMERDVKDRGRNADTIKLTQELRRRQYELFMHPNSSNFDIIIKNNNEDMVFEKGGFFCAG